MLSSARESILSSPLDVLNYSFYLENMSSAFLQLLKKQYLKSLSIEKLSSAVSGRRVVCSMFIFAINFFFWGGGYMSRWGFHRRTS